MIDIDKVVSAINYNGNPMELAGGGVPSNWEVISGSFTPAQDISTDYYVTHNMGKIPTFVVYYGTSLAQGVFSKTNFAGGYVFNTNIPVSAFINSAFTKFDIDIGNMVMNWTYAKAYGYFFTNNSQQVELIATDQMQYIFLTDENTFRIRAVSSSKLKAGVEYKWKAVYINNA